MTNHTVSRILKNTNVCRVGAGGGGGGDQLGTNVVCINVLLETQ